MDGFLWLTSYFALCLVVVWLVLAVIGLYRVQVPRRLRSLDWPSTTLQPGQPVPSFLADRFSRTDDSSSTGSTVALFVVASDEAPFSYAAVASAEALARHYRIPVNLALVSTRRTAAHEPDWLCHLTEDTLHATTILSQWQTESLGLTVTPVLGIVGDGNLMHLVARVFTPSEGRDHLSVFLDRSDDLPTVGASSP